MKYGKRFFLLIIMALLAGCAVPAVPIPTDESPVVRYFGHNTPTCGRSYVITVAELTSPRLDGNDVWVIPMEYGDYWLLLDDIYYPDIKVTGADAEMIKNAEAASPRFAWVQVTRDQTKGVSATLLRLMTADEETQYKDTLANYKSDYPLACP